MEILAKGKTRAKGFIWWFLIYNSASSYANNKAMLLSAVYRCVEVISDSIAWLPLEPYRVD